MIGQEILSAERIYAARPEPDDNIITPPVKSRPAAINCPGGVRNHSDV